MSKRPIIKKGDRVTVPAAQIEFVQGGDTLWIHGPDGSTILRLTGLNAACRFTATRCATSPVPHGDGILAGPLTLCIPSTVRNRKHLTMKA